MSGDDDAAFVSPLVSAGHLAGGSFLTVVKQTENIDGTDRLSELARLVCTKIIATKKR